MNIPLTRVLMIDDDKDEIDILRGAFNDISASITFTAINDCRDILDTFSLKNKLQPDIIFLDLNMPYVRGIECLDYIRRSSLFEGVFVIIYSTSDFIHDIEETYTRGANLYLKKPDAYSELKSILPKVLHLKWQNYIPKPDRKKFV